MTRNHKKLVEDAKEAIKKVFVDTDVSQSDTRSSLKELVEYIDEFSQTLNIEED